MSAHWALRLIHLFYAAFVAAVAWLRKCERKPPNPLRAPRSKIPKHLCLNLVANDEISAEQTENTFLQCLQSVALWCRILGVETLTAYDCQGVLYGCSETARQHVFLVKESPEDSCESEVEYPLTPPHSESSDSRSHSPEHAIHSVDLNIITMLHWHGLRKRKNVAVRKNPTSKVLSSASRNLTLHIASRASGKPAIVLASRSLLQSATLSDDNTSRKSPYNLTMSQLAALLEASLPPPDFMIIHHIGGMKMPYPPIEFHGSPPWQNSLTEFHRTHPDDSQEFNPPRFATSGAITEAAFCRALDEYAGAEFRLGR